MDRRCAKNSVYWIANNLVQLHKNQIGPKSLRVQYPIENKNHYSKKLG